MWSIKCVCVCNTGKLGSKYSEVPAPAIINSIYRRNTTQVGNVNTPNANMQRLPRDDKQMKQSARLNKYAAFTFR